MPGYLWPIHLAFHYFHDLVLRAFGRHNIRRVPTCFDVCCPKSSPPSLRAKEQTKVAMFFGNGSYMDTEQVRLS